MKHATARKHTADAVPRYRPPSEIERTDLQRIFAQRGYLKSEDRQLDLLRGDGQRDLRLYYAGELSFLDAPSVAIVGARGASSAGMSRAYKLARELVGHGVVVVSGLAMGIDTAAHHGAIDNGGKTIAVIGTPLNKAYPAENAALQERIYQEHLLMSPFAPGEGTFRSSFPKRNRVMALISDATVIVEASDTSGSLHQAAECLRSGRWLFIMQSVANNPDLTWPAKFLGRPKVALLTSTKEILDAIHA